MERKIDRFDKYMKLKDLNDNKVTLKLSLSVGTLGKSRKEGRDLSDRVIEQILNNYPDLDKVWLLTGEGDPIRKSDNNVGELEDSRGFYKTRGVPYYEDLDVTASVITSFHDYKEEATFIINYKHFNDCDAYLPVVGDSMHPKYPAGEIVAVKQIRNLDTLLWGETYLVITNDNANNLRTIKDVHYCSDETKVILRAANPDFAGDTRINKEDILSMYIVKGRIRRNQL